MQVTSSTSTPAMTANAPVNASASKQPDNSASNQPESSTKVTLSDEGLQKSAQSDAADTSDSADSASTPDTASSLKSVTYGVLGLPDPTKPQPTDNKAFGLGKGIAAIGTVVSVVMLALKFL